jgi:hypothetical protein
MAIRLAGFSVSPARARHHLGIARLFWICVVAYRAFQFGRVGGAALTFAVLLIDRPLYLPGDPGALGLVLRMKNAPRQEVSPVALEQPIHRNGDQCAARM